MGADSLICCNHAPFIVFLILVLFSKTVLGLLVLCHFFSLPVSSSLFSSLGFNWCAVLWDLVPHFYGNNRVAGGLKGGYKIKN